MNEYRVIVKSGIVLQWFGMSAPAVWDEATKSGHKVKKVVLVRTLPQPAKEEQE